MSSLIPIDVVSKDFHDDNFSNYVALSKNGKAAAAINHMTNNSSNMQHAFISWNNTHNNRRIIPLYVLMVICLAENRSNAHSTKLEKNKNNATRKQGGFSTPRRHVIDTFTAYESQPTKTQLN